MQVLSGPVLHSLWVANVDFIEQVLHHVPPEGLVPQPVNHGADEPRQDLDDDVGSEAYGRGLLGQQVQQALFEHGSSVDEHAQHQLETVEEDGVPGLFKVHRSSLGSKHDPEVSVVECEPNQDEADDVGRVPLLDAVGTREDEISGAENLRVEEVQRLCGQQDEEVRQDGAGTRDPDQSNQDVGFPHRTDLCVAQGDADGDVALHYHPGQIQRGVEGRDDDGDQQDEAEGEVDGVQSVTDDVEERGQEELQHVVYHQVDE